MFVRILRKKRKMASMHTSILSTAAEVKQKVRDITELIQDDLYIGRIAPTPSGHLHGTLSDVDFFLFYCLFHSANMI